MEENALYTTLVISDIQEEIKGVKTIFFDPASSENIGYKAGQYLTFVYDGDGQEIRRSYSIASSPAANEPLAIGVKRVDNGIFSRWLIDHAKIGDKLTTLGAGGFFVLPDEVQRFRQIFLFAAGIGITPVFSILKTVLLAYPQIHVVLIYSNQSPQNTVYLQQLQQLKTAFPDRLQIEFIYSTSPDLYKAHLHAELLVSLLKKYAIAAYNYILFYTCGPVNYMRLCTYTLEREKVPKENIKKENFHIQKVVVLLKPPDTELHTVVVKFKQQEHVLAVQYPVTILQAAKKSGILLPYSCETGVCGNCVARCEKGKVWLSHNEVLTDKEIAQGLTLTCTGYPVEGDATLSIGG